MYVRSIPKTEYEKSRNRSDRQKRAAVCLRPKKEAASTAAPPSVQKRQARVDVAGARDAPARPSSDWPAVCATCYS